MSQQQELKDRLYKFALEIVRLVRGLSREMAAMELGRQLIKAGTSVAANYEEATSAFSKEDFIYKISISFKESKETHLWLRLLRDSGLAEHSSRIHVLIGEAGEIANIFGRSLKTSRSNLDKKKN